MSGDLNTQVIALKSYYDSLRPLVEAGASQRISFPELKARKEHLEQMFMDVGAMEKYHVDMDQMLFLQRKYQELYKQFEYASRNQVNKQEFERNLMRILSEQTTSQEVIPSRAQMSQNRINTMPEMMKVQSATGMGGAPVNLGLNPQMSSPPMLMVPSGPPNQIPSQSGLRQSGLLVNNQQLLPLRNSQSGGTLQPQQNSQQWGADRSAQFFSNQIGSNMPQGSTMQYFNSPNPSFGTPATNNQRDAQPMMATSHNIAPSAPVSPQVGVMANQVRWSGVVESNPWNNRNPWSSPPTANPPFMSTSPMPSNASMDPWNNKEPWTKSNNSLNPPLMRKDSQESIVAKLSEEESAKMISGIRPNAQNGAFSSVDLIPKPIQIASPLVLPTSYDSPMPTQIRQSGIAIPNPMQNSPNFGQPVPILSGSNIPTLKTTENTIDKAAAGIINQNFLNLLPPPPQTKLEQTTSVIIGPAIAQGSNQPMSTIPRMEPPRIEPSRIEPPRMQSPPPRMQMIPGLPQQIPSNLSRNQAQASQLQSNLNAFFSSVNQKRTTSFKSQMNMQSNKRALSPLSQKLRSHHRQQKQSAIQRLTTQNEILKKKLQQNQSKISQNNMAMINVSQQISQSVMNKSVDGIAIQTSQLNQLKKIRELNNHLKSQNDQINRKMDELRDIMEQLAKENQHLREMSRSIQKSAPKQMPSSSSSSSIIRRNFEEDPENRIEIKPNIKPIEYVETFPYASKNVPGMASTTLPHGQGNTIPHNGVMPQLPALPQIPQPVYSTNIPPLPLAPNIQPINSTTIQQTVVKTNSLRDINGNPMSVLPNQPSQNNISYSLYINEASLMESINEKKSPAFYIMQQQHNDLNKIHIASIDYDIPKSGRMNGVQQYQTVREEVVMPPHYIEEIEQIIIEPVNQLGQPQRPENTTVQKRINNGKLEEVVTKIQHFQVIKGANGDIIIPLKEIKGIGAIEVPKPQMVEHIHMPGVNQQNMPMNNISQSQIKQVQVLNTSAVGSVGSFIGSVSHNVQNVQQKQIVVSQEYQLPNQMYQPPNQGFQPPNQMHQQPHNQGFQPPSQMYQPPNQGFQPPPNPMGQQLTQQIVNNMQTSPMTSMSQPNFPMAQQIPPKPMTASTNLHHMSSINSQHPPNQPQYPSEQPPQIARHDNDSMERSFETFKIAQAANSYSLGSFDLKPMLLPQAIPNMSSPLLTRNKVAFFKKSLVLLRSQNYDIAFKRSQLNKQLDMVRLILYVDNKKGSDTPVNISYEYDQSLYRLIVKQKLNGIRANRQGRQQLLISLVDDRKPFSCIVCHIKFPQVTYDLLLPVLFLKFTEGISQYNQTDVKTMQVIAHQQFSNPINLQKLLPLTYLNDEEQLEFLKNQKPYKSQIIVNTKRSKNSLKIDWFKGIITLTGPSKYTEILAFILSDISIR